MTGHKYAMKVGVPHAKVVGRDLSISPKHSYEVCSFLRYKPLSRAKKVLEEVIGLQSPVPYGRFNKDLGHKRGMAAGRFPVKVCREVLGLLDSVEANAQFKGLNTGSLVISHICVHKASTPLRGGRFRGRESKRAHVEVIVEEKRGDSK